MSEQSKAANETGLELSLENYKGVPVLVNITDKELYSSWVTDRECAVAGRKSHWPTLIETLEHSPKVDGSIDWAIREIKNILREQDSLILSLPTDHFAVLDLRKRIGEHAKSLERRASRLFREIQQAEDLIEKAEIRHQEMMSNHKQEQEAAEKKLSEIEAEYDKKYEAISKFNIELAFKKGESKELAKELRSLKEDIEAIKPSLFKRCWVWLFGGTLS